MKRLVFLSAFALLAACTNTEGNIESAKEKIEKARLVMKKNPLDGEVGKLLSDAAELIEGLKAEPLYFRGGKVCSQMQLPFDAENLNLRIKTVTYEVDFANAEKEFSKYSVENNLNVMDSNNYLYLYSVYKKHEDDARMMVSGEVVAKECQGVGANIAYKDEYAISLKEHEEVSNKIAAHYEKKTGLKFSDTVATQEHYQSESRRKQNWDAMSPAERDEAASGRKEVRKCLDAALINNKSATKIANVVSEAATLCRDGLQ